MVLRISWSTQTIEPADSGEYTSRAFDHTLEFDCVTNETHEGASVLTEHAVETGAPISDHKRADPDRITVEAIVTQTPLGAPPPSGYGTTTVVETTSERGTVAFSTDFDRIGDVLDTLRRLRLEATAVTLSTRYHTYEDVQITRVTQPRAPEDGHSARITIELQQVRVATSRSIDAPRPAEPRASGQTDRGGQEATDEATRRPRVSTLEQTRQRYEERRASGESRSDAMLGAIGDVLGGGS